MRTITESNQRSRPQLVAKRRDPESGRWLSLVKLTNAYILVFPLGRRDPTVDDVLEMFEFPTPDYPDYYAAWEAGFRALLRRTEVLS